jgi:hypothetical protein
MKIASHYKAEIYFYRHIYKGRYLYVGWAEQIKHKAGNEELERGREAERHTNACAQVHTDAAW